LNTHEACFCESFESFGIHMKYVLRAFQVLRELMTFVLLRAFKVPKCP
jgi:hypothetical protein